VKKMIKEIKNFDLTAELVVNGFIDTDPVDRNIVMSIHPKYADAILSGRKKVELRRVFLATGVKHAYIYATEPVGLVIGKFTIVNAVSYIPETYGMLWHYCRMGIAIEKTEYDLYVSGANMIRAISIASPIRCTPFPIRRFLGADGKPIGKAPKNYQYVTGYREGKSV